MNLIYLELRHEVKTKQNNKTPPRTWRASSAIASSLGFPLDAGVGMEVLSGREALSGVGFQETTSAAAYEVDQRRH